MNGMAPVTACDATECAFNMDSRCHALGITVGHVVHQCATYFRTDSKGGEAGAMAGVAACQAEDCRYNEALTCVASGVQIGHDQDRVECFTYMHV